VKQVKFLNLITEIWVIPGQPIMKLLKEGLRETKWLYQICSMFVPFKKIDQWLRNNLIDFAFLAHKYA